MEVHLSIVLLVRVTIDQHNVIHLMVYVVIVVREQQEDIVRNVWRTSKNHPVIGVLMDTMECIQQHGDVKVNSNHIRFLK